MGIHVVVITGGGGNLKITRIATLFTLFAADRLIWPIPLWKWLPYSI